MSSDKQSSQCSQRKPYKPPALKKLSLHEAKAILEADSSKGDEQKDKMLEEIRRMMSENK